MGGPPSSCTAPMLTPHARHGVGWMELRPQASSCAACVLRVCIRLVTAGLREAYAQGDVAELFNQMRDMEAKYQAEIKELMERHLAEVAELEEAHKAELERLQRSGASTPGPR